MNTPVVPVVATQLVVGFKVVAQQVPRAVIAEPPSEVTLAPRVAPVEVMAVAVGELMSGAVAAADTVMVVQAPQLSLSFAAGGDSVMTPTIEALLSAQARTEYEPVDGNV